jgi:hypothetical protein
MQFMQSLSQLDKWINTLTHTLDMWCSELAERVGNGDKKALMAQKDEDGTVRTDAISRSGELDARSVGYRTICR